MKSFISWVKRWLSSMPDLKEVEKHAEKLELRHDWRWKNISSWIEAGLKLVRVLFHFFWIWHARQPPFDSGDEAFHVKHISSEAETKQAFPRAFPPLGRSNLPSVWVSRVTIKQLVTRCFCKRKIDWITSLRLPFCSEKAPGVQWWQGVYSMTSPRWSDHIRIKKVPSVRLLLH